MNPDIRWPLSDERHRFYGAARLTMVRFWRMQRGSFFGCKCHGRVRRYGTGATPNLYGIQEVIFPSLLTRRAA